jgi:hypothetical protein
VPTSRKLRSSAAALVVGGSGGEVGLGEHPGSVGDLGYGDLVAVSLPLPVLVGVAGIDRDHRAGSILPTTISGSARQLSHF